MAFPPQVREIAKGSEEDEERVAADAAAAVGVVRVRTLTPALRWRPVQPPDLRQVSGEGPEVDWTGLFRPAADDDRALLIALREIRGLPHEPA